MSSPTVPPEAPVAGSDSPISQEALDAKHEEIEKLRQKIQKVDQETVALMTQESLKHDIQVADSEIVSLRAALAEKKAIYAQVAESEGVKLPADGTGDTGVTDNTGTVVSPPAPVDTTPTDSAPVDETPVVDENAPIDSSVPTPGVLTPPSPGAVDSTDASAEGSN